MMRILAITFGDSLTGSTRYRLSQFQNFFEKNGIHLEIIPHQEFNEKSLDKIAQADVVINQKCLLPKKISKAIIKNSKKIIFDLDDAIYTRPGKPYSWITRYRIYKRLKYWISNSDRVLAANSHLKKYVEKFSSSIDILPMSLDLNHWKPNPRNADNKIRIGWAGAPNNLHHIESLERELTLLLQDSSVELAIYCGKKPALSCRHVHIPFQPGTEVEFIQSLDIGLLPLSDEEFSKGKSPIKAIQYLACGVPVVGNIYGATQDILNSNNSLIIHTISDWIPQLKLLIENKSLRTQLGQFGRNHVKINNCLEKNGTLFINFLL